ncbi:Major Facilitator Superfamily protein [uncultured archaeon]|nr:Major Facilitator Superfamily protein [uncultured archaeon]
MMKDVVGKETGKYFGNRNKILGISTLLVMLGCGFLLNYFQRIDLLFFGFLIIFGIAFVARLVSWNFLKKHYDPKFKCEEKNQFTFAQFIRAIPRSNFGKFVVFIALAMFGTYIASPFFSVYLLKNLNLDYATWILVTISNPLSTLIFMPLWGKFADKFGNLKVLKWTGALTFLIPILYFFTMFMSGWNVVPLVAYLFAIEFFSGFIWAGFNLSSVNFIYDAVSRQKLALCIAYYNIFSGVGVFAGATIGGFISSMNFSLFGISSILFIFLLSALTRIVFYFMMIPKIKEVRKVQRYKSGEFRNELKSMFVPIYNRLGIKSI